MKSLHEIKVPDTRWDLSLVALFGPITDVQFQLTNDLGDAGVKLMRIVFASGMILGCEGEHDLPYVTAPIDGEAAFAAQIDALAAQEQAQ